MRQALGLTLSVASSNRAGDAATTRRCERALLSNPRLASTLHRPRPASTTSTRSHLPPSSAGSTRAAPPRRAAAAAAAASSGALELDHPAFSPVVSLPLRGGGGGSSSPRSPLVPSRSPSSSDGGGGGGKAVPLDTLVVRPLHPSDVQGTADALLAAFEEGDASSGDPPVERRQLLRRLEREARRYSADPGPWLLHSVSLPPPRAPKAAEPSPSAAAGSTGEETGGEKLSEGPWWPSLPASAASLGGLGVGLPGSLKRRGAAELEALEEERAAAAWEEALEDAWGRWLWLVAEARSSSSGSEEGGEGGEERERKVVGAAALLFHDRSCSLRALERLAASELGSAPENKNRWPVADAAAMDYCLWLRESFPAAGWPPRAPGAPTAPASCEGVFGRCASLWWVGTLPAARGRGVGAALLDACAAVAAAAGVSRMFAQVEEWSGGGLGGGGAGAAPEGNNRGRRSGGLAGAPWLGSETFSSSSPSPPPPSPVERMYRSAGFVAVPDPPQDSRSDAGAVDRSAVLLQKEIW